MMSKKENDTDGASELSDEACCTGGSAQKVFCGKQKVSALDLTLNQRVRSTSLGGPPKLIYLMAGLRPLWAARVH